MCVQHSPGDIHAIMIVFPCTVAYCTRVVVFLTGRCWGSAPSRRSSPPIPLMIPGASHPPCVFRGPSAIGIGDNRSAMLSRAHFETSCEITRVVLGNAFLGGHRRGGIATWRQFFGGRRFCHFGGVTTMAEAVKPKYGGICSAVMQYGGNFLVVGGFIIFWR